MDAKQRFIAAYWGLVLYFRKIEGPFIPESQAQSEARRIITEVTRCAKAWKRRDPGGTLGEAIAAAESFNTAYRLLLAYAQREEDGVGAPRRDPTWHYNTQQMRLAALEAAKEAG